MCYCTGRSSTTPICIFLFDYTVLYDTRLGRVAALFLCIKSWMAFEIRGACAYMLRVGIVRSSICLEEFASVLSYCSDVLCQ